MKYGRSYACVKDICRKIKTGCRRDYNCPKGRKFVELKGKSSLYSITITGTSSAISIDGFPNLFIIPRKMDASLESKNIEICPKLM